MSGLNSITQPEPQGPSDAELDELWTDIDGGGAIWAWQEYARAVLSRWGHPALAQPELQGVTDEAWQEFIYQVQHAQHVALREGEGPRFDLVECALALWREAIPPAPEPQGPSDEEILALSQWHEVSYTLSDGRVVYPLQEGADMKDAVLSFTRAVLARWGRPAVEPVPVSERLPGPEDCDADGRCWFWDWGWELLDRTYGCNSGRSHWLPHNALPVPQQEVE
jgi:hypothetical protein